MSRSKAKRSAPARSADTGARGVGSRSFKRQAQRTSQQLPRREARVKRTGPAGRSAREWLLGTFRRVPLTAWLCAAVACLNATCWSIVTPPFQVPDEPEHIAYVKQLAEKSRLPTREGNFSVEELALFQELRLQSVAERPQHKTIATAAEQQKLQHLLSLLGSRPAEGSQYAGVAAAQPPLYYALEAFPYTIGRAGTLLDRIALMRLLSAIFGGLTALFTFLFVRETLPRVRWAWTVGGLGVALVPLLGFMSGAVNPDSMLVAVTAAIFYCLARGFRRGLTRKAAVVLGAATAVGFATKLNFVGIAPGVILGLILLSVRAARTAGRAAYVSLAIALAIALAPPALYVLVHAAAGHSTFGIVSNGIDATQGSLSKVLSYIWQLYLPPLPTMHHDFTGLFTAWHIWFKGYVGLYGWLDTTFPQWVYELALIPTFAIIALCARSLYAQSRALRGRLGELLVYGAMGLGLMVLIGADSYHAYPKFAAEYGQARYLLPLIPLLGLVLALAARAGGRRWGPVIGAAIVLLIFGHDIISQLQVIARFYG
jgi:hypothetical protein